jgi:hypothetical protein
MRFDYGSLVGSEINGLKILELLKVQSTHRKRSCFECQCICGTVFTSRADHVKNGLTKSCGCITYQLSAVSHTLSNNQAAINRVYKSYKDGAKVRSLSFNLSMEEFKCLIFQNCIYCGTAPSLSTFRVNKSLNRELVYNGIDRLDSNLGYSVDNCVPCCSQCNYAKSDLSVSDFRSWIKQLVSFNSKDNRSVI